MFLQPSAFVFCCPATGGRIQHFGSRAEGVLQVRWICLGIIDLSATIRHGIAER